MTLDPRPVAARLAEAGFVAAGSEATDLVAAAGGDARRLEAMLARRLTGEPLAWITGRVTFTGQEILVASGVYVPRPTTEALARRAVELLPGDGIAVDLCTGSGAVAKVLAAARPKARVVAGDVDARAVAGAVANGVEARQGDLFDAVPADLVGSVDVVVAVAPYVPTDALALLARDTFTFESRRSYDGGPDGTVLLRRVVADSPRFLRPGGWLLLELGGGQVEALAPHLRSAGFGAVSIRVDEEGDVRAVEARLGHAW